WGRGLVGFGMARSGACAAECRAASRLRNARQRQSPAPGPLSAPGERRVGARLLLQARESPRRLPEAMVVGGELARGGAPLRPLGARRPESLGGGRRASPRRLRRSRTPGE